jgi:hypothetical protein
LLVGNFKSTGGIGCRCGDLCLEGKESPAMATATADR